MTFMIEKRAPQSAWKTRTGQINRAECVFLKKKQKKMDNKSATGDENNNQALKTNIQLQIMMSTHLN